MYIKQISNPKQAKPDPTMESIKANITAIRASLPEGVELVAVSKFHPVEALQAAYDAGQRVFGESRAVELAAKATALPSDIRWHFIGHLQTNKVRQVVPHAALIHSIDSERLLRAVNTEATKTGRTIDILLQLHVAQEETKFGFTPDELISLVESGILDTMQAVRAVGVMGMASNTDDEARIAADFEAIRSTFDHLKSGAMASHPEFTVISMGMSDDHRLAIAHGSNMVRIGSSIFGSRGY